MKNTTKLADQLRQKIKDDENKLVKNEGAITQRVLKLINQKFRTRSHTEQSLPASVVAMLKSEGFTVIFHPARGMGDVDSHTISW